MNFYKTFINFFIKLFIKFLYLNLFKCILPVLTWLCIKPGIQERGTKCGERGEWGECCNPGISPNIPGNVFKHYWECRQIFRGISSNIPANVLKHSGECHQTFRGMMPIFRVKEDNYWAGWHLESCQTSTMELFFENNQWP